MSFSSFALDKRLNATLAHLAFDQPTPIQQQAIPLILAGHDLIACSQTGSGKTLAFVLPAMQHVMNRKAYTKRDPRVLILTPTRELAKQVFTQLRLFTANTQFKAVLLLGGENFNDQVKTLSKDPHFIVATPGRLADHLNQGHFYLHGLELLILDEADRMLDLGFAEQLTQVHQAADHRKRQTLMFSATIGHEQLNDFAMTLLNQPKQITINQAYEEHENISKRFYFADNVEHKQALLLHLLKAEQQQLSQAIVFTATREDTERLASWLTEQNFQAIALSGELIQQKRNQVIEQFAKGKAQILVTTDLASRGLDLVNVSHVINFDLPRHTEEFVHRIGRTGRAGQSGVAFSFVGPKDWQSFNNIQGFLRQQFSFDSIAQLPAKFKGFSVKQKIKAQAKATANKQNAKASNKPTKTAKHKKVFYQAKDVGDLPIMKKVNKLEDDDKADM